MSIRSKDRRERLLDALKAGEVDVDNLARRFGVSASTVRRDLQQLSEANAVHRTYGGAILNGRAAETTVARIAAAQSRMLQAPLRTLY